MATKKLLAQDGLATDKALAVGTADVQRQYDLAVAQVLSAKTRLRMGEMAKTIDPLAKVAAPFSEHNGSWTGSMQESAGRKGTRDHKYRQHVLVPDREAATEADQDARFETKQRQARTNGSTGQLSAQFVAEMEAQNGTESFDYDALINNAEAKVDGERDLAELMAKYEDEIAVLADDAVAHHNDADLPTETEEDRLRALEAQYGMNA